MVLDYSDDTSTLLAVHTHTAVTTSSCCYVHDSVHAVCTITQLPHTNGVINHAIYFMLLYILSMLSYDKVKVMHNMATVQNQETLEKPYTTNTPSNPALALHLI